MQIYRPPPPKRGDLRMVEVDDAILGFRGAEGGAGAGQLNRRRLRGMVELNARRSAVLESCRAEASVQALSRTGLSNFLKAWSCLSRALKGNSSSDQDHCLMQYKWNKREFPITDYIIKVQSFS